MLFNFTMIKINFIITLHNKTIVKLFKEKYSFPSTSRSNCIAFALELILESCSEFMPNNKFPQQPCFSDQ